MRTCVDAVATSVERDSIPGGKMLIANRTRLAASSATASAMPRPTLERESSRRYMPRRISGLPRAHESPARPSPARIWSRRPPTPSPARLGSSLGSAGSKADPFSRAADRFGAADPFSRAAAARGREIGDRG